MTGIHSKALALSGWPRAVLFSVLDRVEEDYFFLFNILNDTLCYQVDKISVVEPSDTKALMAEEDQDLATLLTCTPYGVNSHRLLVRGHRVPYEEAEDEIVAASAFAGSSLHTNYLLWVLVGLAVTAGFCVFLYLMDRRLRSKKG